MKKKKEYNQNIFIQNYNNIWKTLNKMYHSYFMSFMFQHLLEQLLQKLLVVPPQCQTTRIIQKILLSNLYQSERHIFPLPLQIWRSGKAIIMPNTDNNSSTNQNGIGLLCLPLAASLFKMSLSLESSCSKVRSTETEGCWVTNCWWFCCW